MVSAVDMAINPKKRVFLALVLFSAIVTAVFLFFAWKVTYLGFEAISQFLPAAFGFLVFGAVFFLSGHGKPSTFCFPLLWGWDVSSTSHGRKWNRVLWR